MLESLSVENYAVVKKTSLELSRGMSAITGETGAGKSIAIDALELALGGRADAKSVRANADNATICAVFNLNDAPRALAFLKEKDLITTDDDIDLCIIRRSISKDGRSRGYVNERNVSNATLKELGSMLLNIHGQHDGQLLLKSEYQIAYLDAYGSLGPLISETSSLYHTYYSLKKNFNELVDEQNKNLAEMKLVHYQIAELEKFAPKQDEYSNISQEADKLNHLQTLIADSNQVVSTLTDENGILASLYNLQNKLISLSKIDTNITPISNSFEEIRISTEEIANDLEKYSSTLELDPERTIFINERLEQYTSLARKYNVHPKELYKTLEELQTKAQSFSSLKDEIEACKEAVKEAKSKYMDKALELRQKRINIAPKFASEVMDMLHQLSMPKAIFNVEFSESSPQDNGIDTINFMFSANLGLAPDLISHTASGGEISRIALAILVLTANKISTPTLIFDEIDTGISGQTAAVTGTLLRRLGLNSQVITVTHLPQVAASAHHHYEVIKKDEENSTTSYIHKLNAEGRILEIARLLGGENISDSAIANAKELIKVQTK